jgi:hypothetical protein
MRKVLGLFLATAACSPPIEYISDRHTCIGTETDTDTGDTSTSDGEESSSSASTGEGSSSSPEGSSSTGAEDHDDLAELSDDFDIDGLDNAWTVYQAAGASRLEVIDGALEIEPDANTLWYNASTGVGVYKNVEGSFRMTAHVRVFSLDGLGWPEIENWQLGGIQIRNEGAPSNAVHLALGKTNQSGAQIEPKSTVDGVSQWSDTDYPTAEALLRVCRHNNVVIVSEADPVAQLFNTVGAYSRPELDSVVQAGFMTYANTAIPRFEMRVLSVTFERVQSC